jgi:hypothetical protein
MAEINSDAAALALAAIGEIDGTQPLADRFREEQALRVATFTDLELPTARRVVETAYHATTLADLLIRVNAVGTGREITAALRNLKRTIQGLPGFSRGPDGDQAP